MRLSETGMVTLAVLLSLLFVVRPVILRLSLQPAGLLAGAGAAGAMTAGLAGGGEGDLVAGGVSAGGLAGTVSGPGGNAAALSGPGGEELMMLANVEGALRASSVRKISALVDSHPQESLALLRNWFVEESE